MANPHEHLDDLFKNFPYTFGEVSARKLSGADGRDVLQLRIDMGVLQMEATGKPDGSRPGDFDTYYDYLVSLVGAEGESFVLDDARCLEIDREFVQFFHRRISWLALREFDYAILDAEHTLKLMDFCSLYSPDQSWSMMHEQYRPFVLFHHTQAGALVLLEDGNAAGAIEALDQGLTRIGEVFLEHDAEEEMDDDELVTKLREMKDSITNEYEVQPSLAQQLAVAIDEERYELAAELRDKIARRKRRGA